MNATTTTPAELKALVRKSTDAELREIRNFLLDYSDICHYNLKAVLYDLKWSFWCEEEQAALEDDRDWYEKEEIHAYELIKIVEREEERRADLAEAMSAILPG